MDILNNNKVVAGVSMLMLNLGAKYVQADLGKSHELLLSNPYVKKIIVFCMFFVATRDILIAMVLTVFYIIIVDGVLHENRKFCLIPKQYLNKQIHKEEYEKAKQIVNYYDLQKNVKPNNIDKYQTYLQTKKNLM